MSWNGIWNEIWNQVWNALEREMMIRMVGYLQLFEGWEVVIVWMGDGKQMRTESYESRKRIIF